MDQRCKNCHRTNPQEALFCTHCGEPLVSPRKFPDERRVVITGMGTVSPLGLTLKANWEALLQGKSGVYETTKIPNIDRYACNFSGEVKDFDPQDYMDSKAARRITETSQYAVAAAHMAYDDASLGSLEINGRRAGVVIGTAAGGAIAETERAVQRLIANQRVSPIRFNSVWPNMGAFEVARTFNFTGYNATIVTACASGTQSLATASQAIRNGTADLMLAGGADAFNTEVAIAGYSSMGVLSQRNDDPQRASRPFDKDRDGLVPGEGAAILVLENLAHARARGAHIYAEILGYGIGSDARHETEPTPASQAQTMHVAIDSAGISPEDIDYINAHATSTRLGDARETEAIKLVFGERAYQIPVSATKSMTGHMLGAAGAFEAIVCVLSIRDGCVHPTINYETPDPECDLDCVPNHSRQARVNVALSNSFGFGGQNASIVIAAFNSHAS